MKRFHLILFWLASTVPTFASVDTTVTSLIGHEIFINDDWAGQSFVLRRSGDSIEVTWQVLGSGVPVVSKKVYPVEVRSEKVCVFSVQVRGEKGELREPRSEVKIDLSRGREMTIYVNGIRVHFWEKNPNRVAGGN